MSRIYTITMLAILPFPVRMARRLLRTLAYAHDLLSFPYYTSTVPETSHR